MQSPDETSDRTAPQTSDLLFALARPAFEADAVTVRELFAGLGFPAERTILLTGSRACAQGLLAAMGRAPGIGPGGRAWFYCAGPGTGGHIDGHVGSHGDNRAAGAGAGAEAGAGAARVARAVFRADCPRRVMFLDRPGTRSCGRGVLATALTQHLKRAPGLPTTAGELAARLLGIADIDLSAASSAMVLFPHLLDAAAVHRLRRRAADAEPPEAAAIWRELALLDPQDTDARLLQAHFEELTRGCEPPF